MKTFVIDANVAAKWCLPPLDEAFIPQANRLADQHVAGKISLLVPDLFWCELANVLWKAARRGRISSESAPVRLGKIASLGLTTVPSADLVSDALQIAMLHDRTVYDSVYVALAVRYTIDLITADERLANALAAHQPVKWLGSV